MVIVKGRDPLFSKVLLIYSYFFSLNQLVETYNLVVSRDLFHYHLFSQQSANPSPHSIYP